MGLGAARNDLLDSVDYAADTNRTDIAAATILHFSFAWQAVTHGCLGGTLMKRTLLVLALAVLSSAGCRVIGPQSNCQCGNCDCGEPVYDGYQYDDSYDYPYDVPQPVGGCDACGQPCSGTVAGCVENSYLYQGGGDGEFFARYCGCGCGGAGCDDCGCGDGCPGPYDCSPCNSPAWGCNGYGYCQAQCRGMCHGAGAILASGFCGCCGAPAPSCCCNSGDQNYNFMPGPPVGQTAYPYYTLRGPRDFLRNNPPKLGPY